MARDLKFTIKRYEIWITTEANPLEPLQQIVLLGGVVFHLQKSLLEAVLTLEAFFAKLPLKAPTLKVWNFRGGSGRDQNHP